MIGIIERERETERDRGKEIIGSFERERERERGILVSLRERGSDREFLGSIETE